jgi:predicted ArsR family transcriptional regulator
MAGDGSRQEKHAQPEAGGAMNARSGTKKSILLALLSRSEGASVHEIMAALGWQSHSVRGYLSSLSKQGTSIHSFRRSDGNRAYSINRETESKAEAAQIVARTNPAWILKKGGEDCSAALDES